MDIFKAYSVNPALEQEGKWFPIGDAEFLVARAQNPTYQRMLNKLYEAHRHTLEAKDTDAERKLADIRSNAIMAEVLAHTVLLGWKGNVTFKGEPIAYSVANAQEMLKHKEFMNVIAGFAGDFKNYRFEEQDAKNSPTISAGNSSGEASLTSSAS